jgi:hypothetical protein
MTICKKNISRKGLSNVEKMHLLNLDPYLLPIINSKVSLWYHFSQLIRPKVLSRGLERQLGTLQREKIRLELKLILRLKSL